MQLKKKLRFQLLFVAILSCFLLGFSCDKSVEPVEPTFYQFYFADAQNNRLYTYTPGTNRVDSVEVPWGTFPGITASADGKLIYFAQGNSIIVAETDSLTFVAEIPYPSLYPVSVSLNNKYIALTGNQLFILRTSDYKVVYRDSSQILYVNGAFSSDSKTFFCASLLSPDSSSVVLSIDLSNDPFQLKRRGLDGGSVVNVIPSIDNTKLFLYVVLGLWTWSFQVYDMTLDSIIFRDELVPGSGSLVQSLDGRFVYYTSPGRTSTDPPANQSFTIFDVEKNKIDTVVIDSGFFCSPVGCMPPKLLAVTPDGNWLGILGGGMFLLNFYVYDIKERKAEFRLITTTEIHQFTSISSQSVQ